MTALDWVGAAVALLGSVFCFQFPFFSAPEFRRAFAELGGELPALTTLGLTWWFPLLLGLPPVAPLAMALAPRRTLAGRRVLIIGAFFVSLLCSGLCLYAVYAPIFAIAGAVK